MTREDPRSDWTLVATAGVAVFMAQLDTTAVNVALPAIQHDLGTGTGTTEWVVLGYALPLIALALPAGRLLDRAGRRAALTVAVAGFAAASTLAGLAGDIGWLVAARVVQGGFGALLFALVPVLATTAVRPAARGRAMGVVMTLGPLGGVSGPALGGIVIETLGRSWIFYLNVPVSAVIIAAGYARLPAGRPLPVPGRDWIAESVTLGGAAAVVMVAFSLTAGHGPAWFALAPAAVPFVLAWRRTAGSGAARELVRLPAAAGPHLALLAEMGAVMAAQFLVPFHLRAAGVRPAEIGVTMLAFPAAVMVAGPAGGVLADRWGPRRPAVIGTVVLTAGLALTVPLDPGWGPAALAWRLAVAGLGAGLFAGPNQAQVMAAAPRRLLGTAGGSTSLARQLGVALGPALATTAWGSSGYDPAGMRLAFGLATALALASVAALTVGARGAAPGTPAARTAAVSPRKPVPPQKRGNTDNTERMTHR